MEHHEGVFSQIIEVSQANSHTDYISQQLVQEIIVQNDSNQVVADATTNCQLTDGIVHNDKQMENVILQQVAINDTESLPHLNNVDGTIVAYSEEHKEGDFILHDQSVVYQEHFEVTSTEIHKEIVSETITQTSQSVPQIDINESVPVSTHDQPIDNHIVESHDEIVEKFEVEVVNDTKQDISNVFTNENNAAAFISTFNTETIESMEVDEVCTSNEVIHDSVVAVEEQNMESEDHSISNVNKEKVIVDSSHVKSNDCNNESGSISSTGQEQVEQQEQTDVVTETTPVADSKILGHSDDVAILTEFSANEYNTQDEFPEDEVHEVREASTEVAAEEVAMSEEVAVTEEVAVAEEQEEKTKLVEQPDSNECVKEQEGVVENNDASHVELATNNDASHIELSTNNDASLIELSTNNDASLIELSTNNDTSNTELVTSNEEEDINLQLSTQSSENHTSKVIQDIFDDWQDENGEEESNHDEQSEETHNDLHQDSVELELQNLLNDGAQQEQTVSSTIENIINSSGESGKKEAEKITRSQKSPSIGRSSVDTRSSRSPRSLPAKESTHGRSSRSSAKDLSDSKTKQPSPRTGVKQPGSHLTSQIASSAEITEVLKERLREKQKDVSLPKSADLVFVKKITQRLSNQLLSGTPTVAPTVTPPVLPLPTSTSENSSVKEKPLEDKKIETRRTRNESAGDRELLAILEGDVDPDWAYMDSNTSNEKQNTSSSKLDPMTERELALKQLQELPSSANKKSKQDANQLQKKSRKSKQEEKSGTEAKSVDETEVTNSDSVSEKTPVRKGRPPKASKKENKDDSKKEDKVENKKHNKVGNVKESKDESKKEKENKSESKKEKESKIETKKEKETKKESKAESKKENKDESKKENKDESTIESNVSTANIELGIEESRSGRKRKLTEKAREHELAVKRQKVTKKAVSESRKSSQESIESDKSQKSDISTLTPKESEIPSSTSTPKSVLQSKAEPKQTKAETKQTKTEAKQTKADVKESTDETVEQADTIEESSLTTETPVKKAKIGMVKKDAPISKRKLAVKNLIRRKMAGKKSVGRPKMQEKASLLPKAITPSKETPDKAINTSGSVKPKKYSEVDRLLQDEGIVNILYDVEQTDSKRRLVPITKTQKKVMDVEKAERELNFRKKMVKNAVLRSRNADVLASAKISPRVRRFVAGEASLSHSSAEKKANDTAKSSKVSNTSTPVPSDFVTPAKIRNAADASRIIRRHSSSSFSSASASPRVSIDQPADSIKIEEPEPQTKPNRKLSNASDKQDVKKGKKRASVKSEVETDESATEKTPTKKATRSNVVPVGEAKSTKAAANKSKKVPKSKSVSESSSTDNKSSPKRNEELSACLAEVASALSSSVNGSTRSSTTAAGRKKGSTNITKLLTADDEKVDSKKLLFSNKEIYVRHHEHLVQLTLTPSASASNIRNAITIEAMNEIRETLSILKKDDDCRVVLFTSTGSSFCEGLELSSLLHSNKEERKARAEELASAVKDFIRDLAAFNKPIVAAVQGAAIGLGVTMLPLFDLVIASDKATFCTPYGKLGQIAEGAAVLTLSHSLGSAVTNELLLGGRVLTASEALRAGLVTRVLWPDRFQGELMPPLKTMSEQSSQSMIATKALLRHDLRQKLDVSLESETLLLVQHWCSQECQEAIKAHISGKSH